MSCDDVNTKGDQEPWEAWEVAVLCLLFGLASLTMLFDAPGTSYQGFSSDAVPTINDRGDIDCGGSSLRVVLHGQRVAIPPGDLARRAEKACRDDAVASVWWGGGFGLAFVVFAGSRLVLRARRYRARRAKGPGHSGDRVVPDRLLENGTLVRPD